MGEKVYGLLGRKLGHSWSAPIHAALGCADYRLIELEPEELGAFLAREDIGGLNVTIPYKRDVMAYCDVLDPMAEAIGSVNTLVRRADGKLYGYNTDAAGFCFMAQRAGIGFAGKKTLVLGSGRRVAHGGCVREKAWRARGGCHLPLGREQLYEPRPPRGHGADRQHHTGRDVSEQRCGGGRSDRLSHLRGRARSVYNPRRTALLLQAEELGIPCSDGLPMLVAQAKAAEEPFL